MGMKVMTKFFRRQIIEGARPVRAGLAAMALLLAGAGAQSAVAQTAPRIQEGQNPNLPLDHGTRPPPPQVNEPPLTPPPPGPGQTVAPFAPPPVASIIREQEALQKRLQDGYEGREEAIKAMLDPTRVRLLSGYTDTDEAVKRLYANGAEVAEELKLTPGIALTREQVALLRKDIIWQVRIKKNGRELLVPRLYTANGRIVKN
jgi:hypothetical protein